MSLIYWQHQNDTLSLSGVLDRNSLDTIWPQRLALFSSISAVDVAALNRVDSAGLALLVNCCLNFNIKLIGVSAQLSTLIQLYNLEKVIQENDK